MTPSAAASQRSAPSDAGFADLVEELTARLHAGEVVDLDAFLRDHPDHAERLSRLLPALRLLADVSRSRPDGMAAASVNDDPDALAGTLGDFRIVREVGRGGMGVVYEAEQISLRRRVALKVLPFAGAMDTRQLQRFKNEAHAAAQLHHTNVVPVYSVGCERGVHFYAMQYIEGRSLADVIRELRRLARPESAQGVVPTKSTPFEEAERAAPAGSENPPGEATTAYTPLPAGRASASMKPIAALSTVRSTKDAAYSRIVAELGIQAAEALDFAHERGVIHRDVKPANLLVDAAARLWVTDFGLAQVQGDVRMTMSGDLLGTLRYMSPEQALAKRVVVDHRTDIYSLGATLYELLTLEPAYRGNDRQELLRQISFEEPRPPRRLNKAIAPELETIVLKALEKNPAERYATAKDLADDLRHFLEDKPIRARRPGVSRRAVKWARRHRAATIAALVCLLVTLAVTIGAVGWVIGDRNSRQRQAETIVLQALDAAKPGLDEGNPHDHALVSALKQAEAQQQSGLLGPEMQARVDQLQKDEKMLAEIERITIVQTSVRDDHFDVTSVVREYPQAFREYRIDVVQLEPAVVVDLMRSSALRKHLVACLEDWAFALQDDKAQSQPEAEKIHRLISELDPSPWANQLRKAALSGNVQEFERLLAGARVEELAPTRLGMIGRAFKGFKDQDIPPKGIEFLQRAQALHPHDFWINHGLAEALYRRWPDRTEQAVGFFRAAVAARPETPGARHNLAFRLRDLGRLDEAISVLQKAIDLKPDYLVPRFLLSSILRDMGRVDEAIAVLRKVIDQYRMALPEVLT